MKTNDLRKFIKSQLGTIGNCYYHDAPDNAMFPHIVFDLDTVNFDDYYRSDYNLSIDIWCKKSQAIAEDMADSICELFNAKNLPQVGFLPTFYRENRRNLLDEDKDINHISITFSVQDYDR